MCLCASVLVHVCMYLPGAVYVCMSIFAFIGASGCVDKMDGGGKRKICADTGDLPGEQTFLAKFLRLVFHFLCAFCDLICAEIYIQTQQNQYSNVVKR